MTLAIATGMKELDEKIQEILLGNGNLEIQIVNYREFFDKKDFDVAIVSERLVGDMDTNQLFFLLKAKDTRVIYLTNEEDVKGIKKCFNYSINDILFDPVKPEEAANLVLNPNSFSDISDIYLKYSNMELEKNDDGTPVKVINVGGNTNNVTKIIEKNNEKVVEKIVEKPVVVKETVYKTKILKQKIFAFYTTDNALLTADLITQLGALLSQKVEQKILILDFNTLFPVMDHFLGINKNIDIESKYDVGDNTSLVSMYNAIERNIFSSSNFSKFVKKHPKYKNIDVATGLYDLVLFEKMPNEYFEKIIDVAASLYDTILINTNPDISLGSTFIPLTKATEIICVSEANYTELRSLLFVINNLKAKIVQDKFKIVMSNMTSSSLDEETVKKILEGYEILTFIPYDEARESSLNEQKVFADAFSSKRLTPYIEIMEKLDYIPKTSFWDKVFRSKREDKELVKGGKPLE
ncbi:MinD/ParA family ATP-binding protein [Clostridium hydrogenum]|uniref:MinD/ParA family ATP-binding protein n=1 Tax=Clostridium hydrogenum TaxID=2855764 RepID=UPI001F2A0C38|nr:hypothetical protein [Clostridium hydrogenum]